jgi:hypothetical protein
VGSFSAISILIPMVGVYAAAAGISRMLAAITIRDSLKFSVLLTTMLMIAKVT